MLRHVERLGDGTPGLGSDDPVHAQSTGALEGLQGRGREAAEDAVDASRVVPEALQHLLELAHVIAPHPAPEPAVPIPVHPDR